MNSEIIVSYFSALIPIPLSSLPSAFNCDERKCIFPLPGFYFSLFEVKLNWILNIIWVRNTTIVKESHLTSTAPKRDSSQFSAYKTIQWIIITSSFSFIFLLLKKIYLDLFLIPLVPFSLSPHCRTRLFQRCKSKMNTVSNVSFVFFIS